MAKKQFFLIVDTETAQDDSVVDFGAVLCDRNGEVYKSCGILVNGVFGVKPLFTGEDCGEFWSKKSLERRMGNYYAMLENGQRSIASVRAINRWLDLCQEKYSPIVTAYNLAFDSDKCKKTGIDLTIFNERVCLWHLAVGHICQSKAYKAFVLDNHLFNPPTGKGNMTYQTNAEAVASYVNGAMLPPEPHTALEDAMHYELPILRHCISRKNWREKAKPYNWMEHQVKAHFSAK